MQGFLCRIIAIYQEKMLARTVVILFDLVSQELRHDSVGNTFSRVVLLLQMRRFCKTFASDYEGN
jgi:hypothetical protein